VNDQKPQLDDFQKKAFLAIDCRSLLKLKHLILRNASERYRYDRELEFAIESTARRFFDGVVEKDHSAETFPLGGPFWLRLEWEKGVVKYEKIDERRQK
jgi:hypothetical protein